MHSNAMKLVGTCIYTKERKVKCILMFKEVDSSYDTTIGFKVEVDVQIDFLMVFSSLL